MPRTTLNIASSWHKFIKAAIIFPEQHYKREDTLQCRPLKQGIKNRKLFNNQ